jgi:hypothetical protein
VYVFSNQPVITPAVKVTETAMTIFPPCCMLPCSWLPYEFVGVGAGLEQQQRLDRWAQRTHK